MRRSGYWGKDGVEELTDVLIIGGGVNGLVTAGYLAKAGLKPLVLERSGRVGGCAITTDIVPGFRCPTLTHWSALDRTVVDELGLERHGLRILRADALACAPTQDGRALTIWNEAATTAEEVATFSAADAARYPAFLASFASITGLLRRVLDAPAFVMDGLAPTDIVQLLKTARGFRSLGRPDAFRLLRWIAEPVGDLVGEWFDSEPLRSTLAAGGLLGSPLAPRSAGSGAVLMLRAASAGHAIATGWSAAGGPGAVANALAAAAQAAGAAIRQDAGVARILVK